jgi:short-chain fatty acids transporter
VVLLVVPVVLVLLVPRDPSSFTPPPARTPRAEDRGGESAPGFAGKMERSPWLSLALAALCIAWLVPWAASGGVAHLNPDHVNLVFLALGLVLAGSPLRYMALARQAAGACAGIIVQFPLYGGILGVLAAAGFVQQLAAWLPATESGLALSTFLSAGLLNLFVPSGGGQWAVQGPIVMQAAAEHGLEPGRIVLALAWGDQWTNLFQPFWALPLLGITGTKAGDILGYTLLVGIAVGAVFALGATLG